MKRPGIITLTTDFGLHDPYAAVMKGVILSICPHCRLVDITHMAPPGSILYVALRLMEAYPFFPRGTVHVCVVDPGVGSERRCLAVEANGHFFVGPDNGVFWPILAADPGSRTIHLRNPGYFLRPISATFHGRDIFAPVAAHLSNGADLQSLGEIVEDPLSLEVPSALRVGDRLVGHIVRVDRFGNLITNISRELLYEFLNRDIPVIRIGALVVEGLAKTYASVKPGEAVAIIGSGDTLEIAVNSGSACERIEADSNSATGMEVEVNRRAGEKGR